MKRSLITTLLLILALALLAPFTHPIVAQSPTPPPTATLTVTPTPTPPPAATLTVVPTPTPTFEDRYGKSILEGVIGPLVVLIIGGVLGAIATIIFKPRIEHWAERRKRELKDKEEKLHAEKQAKDRRQIEEERLRAYLDRVATDCSTTRIFTRDQPVLLDEIYTDIYILDRPQAFRRFDITQLRQEPGLLDRSAKRTRGHDFLTDPAAHRFFILGKPGAGKTTFLRHLTRQAAIGAMDKIPILITLREWADSRLDLLPFIVHQFDLYNFPDARPYVEHLLEDTDDALVLFDGLDEIRQEGAQRRRAIVALRDFARRYERAQVLITCRVAATDYTFEGFTYVEIADFTDEQIDTFVRNYFRHSPPKHKAFSEEFAKEDHRGLRELARTPLLLGLLCLNFEGTLTFPRHRDEIYTEALDALLSKWDAKRAIRRDEIYHGLSLKHKRGLFTHLAYDTFQQGEYFFPQRDLEARIVAYLQNLPPADQDEEMDGLAVLRAIEAQHGILVERAHRIHAFAHLTFQEYYAARYVVENVAAGTLPSLLAHADDDRWREVILLTAAMLGNADAFFEHFLQTLNALVQDDEKLTAFLTWAARKAAAVQASHKPAAVRAYYSWLDLDLARDLDRDRAVALALTLTLDRDRDLDRVRVLRPLLLDRDFALARDLALALDRDLDLALDLDLARDLDLVRARRPLLLDRDLDLDRDLALALALDRARALDLVRDLAFALVRALVLALDRALALAQQLGLDALYQVLSSLSAPAEDAPLKDWRTFADALQAIMIEHRDIGHDWGFTPKQSERLGWYFYTTRLLLECLDLSIVTDRAAIENRLLLPPSWAA